MFENVFNQIVNNSEQFKISLACIKLKKSINKAENKGGRNSG